MDRYLEHGFQYCDIRENDGIGSTRFKEMHVSVYSDLPSYTLLSNMNESDAIIHAENGRIVFKGKDDNVFSNIDVNSVSRCMRKRYGDKISEFILEIKGFYYKGIVYKY